MASSSSLASATADPAALAPRPSHPSPPCLSSPTAIQPELITNEAFSKTWVLPPRKKPGRKATNDVPPTVSSPFLTPACDKMLMILTKKRQAQNRAAQKAFRDRKIMKMNELEQENANLRDRLDRMEAEIAALRAAIADPSFGTLSRPVRRDIEFRGGEGTQLASPAASAEVNCETCVVGKDCACINVADAAEIGPTGSTEIREERCGLCSKDSCICEDLGIRERSSSRSGTMPAESSPPHGTKRKRSRRSSPLLPTSEPFPNEIDFTTAFLNNSLPSSNIGAGSDVSTAGCGFCNEATLCVCWPNTLPPLQADSVAITPRSQSEALRRNGEHKQKVDVGLSGDPAQVVRSPRAIARVNGECIGVPGTCLQCQSDPVSTLFCQTLSKKLETPISSIRLPPRPTERPLLSSSSFDHSRDTPPFSSFSSSSRRPTSPDSSPDDVRDTYLPCSAVYRTLSRHRNFNKMSLEVIVGGLAKGEHRGMEFSVDGVEGVLKRMDQRESE